MKIGIDTMGGDFAPEAVVKGAVLARKILSPEVKLYLIGDEKITKNLLEKEGASFSDFEFVPTTEVIEMCDHPAKAFQQKTNSSITVGFHLLEAGKIDGFASAGNTGAMMVGCMYTTKVIEGIIRPCITSALPKEDGGYSLLLDVGINADPKPEVLYQYAILGKIFCENVAGIKNPRIALLNIGAEEEKGNLVVKATHELMKNSKDFNFIGNIEGNELFADKADVIVTDGFTGNVVLKEAESIYALIKKRGRSDEFFERFNYEIYGGTPVLGINSPVIIGHGISNPTAIKNMILQTKEVIEANICQKIKDALK